MRVVYSGMCVRCGYSLDQYSPVPDGSHYGHAASYWDDNGITVSRPCSGVFVSVMGRTRREIYDLVESMKRPALPAGG